MICLKCGRKLRNAASKDTGYGPVCYERLFGTRRRTGGKSSDSSSSDIPYYDIPGQMTIDDYMQTKQAE